MKKVFITILNWNGKDNTIQCLESLEKLDVSYAAVEVIVVDNNSSDDSITSIKKKFPKVVVVENKENLGFAGGNNVGIQYAIMHQADYILILNNDTIVDEQLILQLIQVAEKDKTIGIVTPKIYFEKGFEFHKQKYKNSEKGKVIWYAGGIMDWKNVLGIHRGVDEVDKGQYNKEEETDFASGCCILVKKEVFESVGLLNEKYFLYYEDSDFCERVKRKGFTIAFAPQAILWHKNAGSAGGPGSNLQDYYISRNRLLFGFRYAPLRSKIALLKESLVLLLRGRPWQKKGIRDFYLGRFGKGSYIL